MFDILRRHITKRIPLSDDEFERCSTFFTVKQLKKKQFLLREGDVCRQLAFVNSGCLREYTVDHKGEEHVLQFAITDWWISDITSFLSNTPSNQNIDAVQGSQVLVLEKENREKLFEAVPKLERFFRLLLEANRVAVQKRINDSLSVSAEDRYLSFLKTYPALVEQVPQNQIASYLGITPQSLSRIRKELAHHR